MLKDIPEKGDNPSHRPSRHPLAPGTVPPSPPPQPGPCSDSPSACCCTPLPCLLPPILHVPQSLSPPRFLVRPFPLSGYISPPCPRSSIVSSKDAVSKTFSGCSPIAPYFLGQPIHLLSSCFTLLVKTVRGAQGLSVPIPLSLLSIEPALWTSCKDTSLPIVSPAHQYRNYVRPY